MIPAREHTRKAPPNQPGLHLMGDFYECRCPPETMLRADALRAHCLALVDQAGLAVVGDYFHGFPGGGVTGAIILGESHLSVHTWPEHGYATVDVYVCNYSENNRGKARALFDGLLELFAPRAPRLFAIDRA